jgi:hypothetical protein
MSEDQRLARNSMAEPDHGELGLEAQHHQIASLYFTRRPDMALTLPL